MAELDHGETNSAQRKVPVGLVALTCVVFVSVVEVFWIVITCEQYPSKGILGFKEFS